MSPPGKLLADKRRVLTVPPGKRGLAQSEALFQHIHHLPLLLAELKTHHNLSAVSQLAVSVKPRPRPDSYMPVFLAGEKLALSLAAVTGCPLFETTHQEGHLMAAVFGSDFSLTAQEAFLFCHFSGGTSEICAVRQVEGALSIEIVAQGNDLHAGQFVDCVGVAMGLPFPAGPALEQLAKNAGGDFPRLKIWVKGGEFSFSGPESAVQRRLVDGLELPAAARAVEDAIARTLSMALREARQRTGLHRVLLAGGVMANGYIREQVADAQMWFTAPAYTSDNAVGVAYHAKLSRGLI